MKGEHAVLTTAAAAPKDAGAPFWVKAAASLASVAMLLAISSYNVVPTLRRAAGGDVASIGLAAVQIAFTIILAVIPFVPGWSADTRKVLTLAFMLGNGYLSEAEIVDVDDERARTRLNAWVKKQGLATGVELLELADPDSGEAVAVLDLAWPNGLREGLGPKVAFIADGDSTVMAVANRLGYRCFASQVGFKRFVGREILSAEELQAA